MANFTKKDISMKLAENLEISLSLSSRLVDYFTECIKTNLHENNDIKISGFGTFKISKTPKRVGRNPKTKESFIISERKRIKLVLSSRVRGYIN